MGIRNVIASEILTHWGYYNITVGDLDGRNFKARHIDNNEKTWCGARDKSYKTSQAVAHAYRLADIAIQQLVRSAK